MRPAAHFTAATCLITLALLGAGCVGPLDMEPIGPIFSEEVTDPNLTIEATHAEFAPGPCRVSAVDATQQEGTCHQVTVRVTNGNEAESVPLTAWEFRGEVRGGDSERPTVVEGADEAPPGRTATVVLAFDLAPAARLDAITYEAMFMQAPVRSDVPAYP